MEPTAAQGAAIVTVHAVPPPPHVIPPVPAPNESKYFCCM